MKHILLTCWLLLSPLVMAQEYSRKQTEITDWYNLTQLSFLLGEENESSPAKSNLIPSVVVINGFRINDHFSMGMGLGMTAFSYVVFPVFADLRVTFFKGNLSPVAGLKGGYSFAKNKKEIFPREYYGDYQNTGGGMLNPELGFKVVMTERADFLLTIGYYYQHLESKITTTNASYMTHKRVTDINRLSFTIGFLFK